MEPWEIARALQTGSNHVTKLLDGLEEASLVERRAHAQDRRRRLVHLTDAGLRRVAELEPRVRDLEDRLLSAALSPAERAELRRLTARLRRSLAEVAIPTDRVRPGP